MGQKQKVSVRVYRTEDDRVSIDVSGKTPVVLTFTASDAILVAEAIFQVVDFKPEVFE